MRQMVPKYFRLPRKEKKRDRKYVRKHEEKPAEFFNYKNWEHDVEFLTGKLADYRTGNPLDPSMNQAILGKLNNEQLKDRGLSIQ